MRWTLTVFVTEQLLQEVEQSGQEAEETEMRSERQTEEAGDDEEEKAKDENPLEKYMKMVLEAREKQHVQVRSIHNGVKLLL